MRYGRLFALALVLSLPFMACSRAPGNGEPGAAMAGGLHGAPVKIGVAIDSGSPEDEVRKALVLSGLREAAQALQGRIADDPDRTDFGNKVVFRLVESRVRGEDREQLLRVLAEEGCALVCGVGPDYGGPAATVARDYPGRRFAVIDAARDAYSDAAMGLADENGSGRLAGPSAARAGSPEAGRPGSVCYVSFSEAEGSFLAGALAGLAVQGKPGAKVGFMGGIDDAAAHRYEAGFIAGAASENASLRRPGMILVQYCGRDARARDDAAMASAIARNMYGSGAEIIYHDAGASSGGLFAAAASQGKLAIGADLDQGRAESRRGAQAREASAAIITSMEKRVDRALLLLAQELIGTGTVRGGPRILGLAEGGTGLARNEENRARLAPYSDRIDELVARIASGELRVPEDAVQASRFLKELR
mgnify:CR=1 FL=1